MTLGERIHEIRLQREMSLQDLAIKVGVNKSTIFRYETHGIEIMGADKIKAVAEALRVSPAFLMGWEDHPNHAYYVFRQKIEQYDLSEEDIEFLIQVAQKIAKNKKPINIIKTDKE